MNDARASLDLPPIPPLRALLARLERASLAHALGGSGLLAALGLVERVNDWDVTVDAGIEALAAALDGERYERFGNSGCHADHKLTFRAERVELIARFAFFTASGVVRVPCAVTRHWNGVPVGSPVGWAAAYALMGELERDPRRLDRAERLFAWLERHGADEAGREALLAGPLPPRLRARVEALPRGAS